MSTDRRVFGDDDEERYLILRATAGSNETNTGNYFFSFVKHELKGVLKCIGVELWSHAPGPRPPRLGQKPYGPITDRDRQRRNPP